MSPKQILLKVNKYTTEYDRFEINYLYDVR